MLYKSSNGFVNQKSKGSVFFIHPTSKARYLEIDKAFPHIPALRAEV
jgi:hypothetical protein